MQRLAGTPRTLLGLSLCSRTSVDLDLFHHRIPTSCEAARSFPWASAGPGLLFEPCEPGCPASRAPLDSVNVGWSQLLLLPFAAALRSGRVCLEPPVMFCPGTHLLPSPGITHQG